MASLEDRVEELESQIEDLQDEIKDLKTLLIDHFGNIEESLGEIVSDLEQ